MRILEIALLIIFSLSIFNIILKQDRKHKKIEISVIFGILILHFIVEGFRWQMIPIYFLLSIILLSIYKDFKLLKGNWSTEMEDET